VEKQFQGAPLKMTVVKKQRPRASATAQDDATCRAERIKLA